MTTALATQTPSNNSSVPIFTFNEVVVTKDFDGLVNLNEMWKAAGSPSNRDPRRFAANTSTEDFVASLMRNLNVRKSVIWKARRGKHLGGTWVHWQIALTYAEYLSPDFHQFVHEKFAAFMEEENNPGLKFDRAVDSYIRKGYTYDWIAKRLENKVGRNQFTSVLSSHLVEGYGYADCTDAVYIKLFGQTAREIKASRGLGKRATTRDHFTIKELVATTLAEICAGERIEKTRSVGNQQCKECCIVVGDALSKALEHINA